MVATVLLQIFQIVVLGALGTAVAVYPEWTSRHRWRIVTGAAVASLVTLALSIYVARKQDLDSQKLMDNVTGGNSYPRVVPAATPDGAMLWIWNEGETILTGVTVSIGCGYPQEEQREIVGTLGGHQSAHLHMTLDMKACREAHPMVIEGAVLTDFEIMISAQNGSYWEHLIFKTDPACTGIGIRTIVERLPIPRFDRHHKLIFPVESATLVYPAREDLAMWGGNLQCHRSKGLPQQK